MMENEFYTGEFEQLLKEKADQFRMYPSKRVWHSIYNNLHPSRRWPSVFMSLFLVGSLMLIGYLNTGDNKISRHINTSVAVNETAAAEVNTIQKNDTKKLASHYQKIQLHPEAGYGDAFEGIIIGESDLYPYTVVKSNRPDYLHNTSSVTTNNRQTLFENNTDDDIVQVVDTYIKSNRLFADISVASKKNKNGTSKPANAATSSTTIQEDNTEDILNKVTEGKTTSVTVVATAGGTSGSNNLTATGKKEIIKINAQTDEEKAWIENYAFQNKPAQNKWKGRLAYQFYATPAVNYRKLYAKAKGSTTPLATADINKVISQKPGFGMEAGAGLTYAVAKRLQLKAGVQFNYTNYNIAADQTNHPVATTILLNDPITGYSYIASRISTTSNPFNTTALQPITLHNRTYQISIPVGFAYKLSSENNVDWFAGLSVQPTYVFGGNAHIISTDLKSYVSDPSSIRTWNLNLGFETYMNFKLGSYNLQVGPQVRYQVYSTYRKNFALIEKPYAIGLKFGLTKGF